MKRRRKEKKKEKESIRERKEEKNKAFQGKKKFEQGMKKGYCRVFAIV